MSKGEDTRRAILDTALQLASELGLEGLTIGVLARQAGLSKSGLYAHFDSKEALQIQVLDAASSRWVDTVFAPALKARRGTPRLEALFEHWLAWDTFGLDGGCLFVSAATELDARPGPVRDHLTAQLRDMLGAIRRTVEIAIEEAHFSPATSTEQFAFEMWGLLLTYHHHSRILGRESARSLALTGFAALMDRHRL